MTPTELDKIVYFLLLYGHQVHDEDALRYIITKHEEYSTHEIIWKDSEVIGYTRYNVDGFIATIIDAVVRPEERFKRLLKLMLITGLRKFPYVNKIKYEREFKPRKDWRTFLTSNFLNIKE